MPFGIVVFLVLAATVLAIVSLMGKVSPAVPLLVLCLGVLLLVWGR